MIRTHHILISVIGNESKYMGNTLKLLRDIFVLAIAISSQHAFAADKTGEGASSGHKKEVVTKSKDGIEVHSVSGADKADRERREKREREAKEKN